MEESPPVDVKLVVQHVGKAGFAVQVEVGIDMHVLVQGDGGVLEYSLVNGGLGAALELADSKSACQ